MQTAEERPARARSRALRAIEEVAESSLRIERGADGQLWATCEGETHAVWVTRLFPWSAPDRHVSLRDRDEEEVALVTDVRELDADSRLALEEALAEAGFVLEVEGVDDIDEEVEIRTWKVRTKQGKRFFQTLRDEWPREMEDGSILIRDVAGDLYRVANPKTLDGASRKLIWAFVD